MVKYSASYCWEWKSQKRSLEIDIKIPENNPVFLTMESDV